MRLLVTNDDGIDSVFLRELVFALRAAGHETFVVAPKTEQSWIGAAKSRHRPVHSAAHDRGLGCPTWIVDGTPSDCVNIALAHLLPPTASSATNPHAVDGVVSGINIGLNASISFILASGTIAGAWEGAVHGLPAVAFSQHLSFEAFEKLKRDGGQPDAPLAEALRHSAAHAARLASELITTTAPRSFVVHNVNFPYPCRPDTQVRRTVPARVIVPGLFSPQADDGMHRFVFKLGEDISPSGGPPTDRTALNAGHISHSVLDYSRLGT